MKVLRTFLAPRSVVPVLAYHFTGLAACPEDAPYTLATELFDNELCHLRNTGYECISLRHLHAAITGSADWPHKGAVITFDDGRSCVYREAFPILKKHDMKATVFLISSRLDNPRFLSRMQIHEMEQFGIEFESHGHSHISFAELTAEQMLFEATQSKAILDKVLATPVSFFAYPFGHGSRLAGEVLREAGYLGAVCSVSKLAARTSSPYWIPRFGMRGWDSIETFSKKLNGNRHSRLHTVTKMAGLLGRRDV